MVLVCLQTGDPRAGQSKKVMTIPDYDPSWDPLTLEYQVKWPLHLILTPQVQWCTDNIRHILLEH